MHSEPPRAVLSDDGGDAAWPLGAHRLRGDARVTTFGVHAPSAERVELELYPSATGSDASASFTMARGTDGVWYAAIDGLDHGALYAFRCWGPNWRYDEAWRRGGSAAGFVADVDAEGHRFNPNKVLFDPYAREITHVPLGREVSDAGGRFSGFTTGGMPYRGRPAREADTGRFAPKGVLIFDAGRPAPRPATTHNPAIYEAHVKNLTMHPTAARLGDLLAGTSGFERVVDVPDALRGTYAGAAYLAPYLRSLGITTLELLPVHETDTDHRGDEQGTVNHWGYQTLGFFAPNRDYAHDRSLGGPTREFKAMVGTFHEHDIEVLLDVVYNHTGEGGHLYNDRTVTSFTTLGGFAAADYYQLDSSQRLIDGATGTCNQLNFSTPAVRQLVLDSLAYWHDEMGVDGFRFDLAPVLGRHPDATGRENWAEQRRFHRDHPLLLSVRNLAVMEGFEVIAEPWDLWGNEVGNFPTGWLEWNGRFRDATRRFLKGDANTGEFVEQFVGGGLAGADGVRAINFIDAHDGFTMMDLVAFNAKHNLQGPPFGPSDGGSDDNFSWDSGQDHALRRTRWRNAWLTVFCAPGVPMVVAGDEYGRTQNGNNNPWNLNTIGTWNNWAQAASHAPTRVDVDPAHPAGDGGPAYYDVVGTTAAPAGINPLLTYARFVTRLRRGDPGLRHAHWGRRRRFGAATYTFTDATLAGPPREGDRALGVRIDGIDDYLWLVNMWIDPVTFTIPDADAPWLRVIDTAPWAEDRGNVWATPDADAVVGTYRVAPWSMVLLLKSRDEASA